MSVRRLATVGLLYGLLAQSSVAAWADEARVGKGTAPVDAAEVAKFPPPGTVSPSAFAFALVYKNKLFLYGNYEGRQDRRETQSVATPRSPRQPA